MTSREAELRQERADLAERGQMLLDKANQQHRDLNTAEAAEFNKLMADMDELGTKIESQHNLDANKTKLREVRLANRQPERFGMLPGSRSASFTESKPTVLAPTLKAFDGGGDKQQAQRDAYDSGLWIRAAVLGENEAKMELQSRRGEVWMSQNESTNVKGGYLVPAPLQNAIIVAREQVGATRKLARVIPMGSPTLDIPKRTGGLTTYYVDEEASITESDAEFGQLQLDVKKRGIFAYVSNELQRDAIVSVTDMLATEMGHAFALTEDKEFILGDGTSTYGSEVGLATAIGSAGIHEAESGNTTWATLDLNDFYGVMSKIPDKYRVEGQLAWLVSSAFKWQVMDRLAAEVNGAGTTVVVDGQPRAMFLGYPVVTSDRMPTATAVDTVAAYFGNFKHSALLGERDEIRIALSEHYAFKEDRLALRGTTRYDILLHDMGDGSEAGAIVALQTAAS